MIAIAKEVPSGNLGDIPDGWHFYDPETGVELKTVDLMRDIFKVACAMIMLPESIGSEVLAKNAAMIADEDLAGKGREDKPHITLKYGVRESVDETVEVLSEFYPFEVTLGKTKVFPPNQNTGGAAVVYVEAIASELHDLHERIDMAIGCRHDGADYVPHITLGYVNPDEAEKYADRTDFEGMKFTAAEFTIRRAGGDDWAFNIGGAVTATKAGDDEEDEEIEQVILDILKGFEEIVHPMEHELASTHLDQAVEMRDELGLEESIGLSALNERALDYARRRAAEMVGKRWVKGELVDNPNAVWAITDTTRDVLNGLVQKAFREGLTPAQLTTEIERTGAFSSSRADMIASTEMARAQVQGSLSSARDMGVVGKEWETSGDHDIDDECDTNEDDGIIALDENFSSGDDGPPGHPNCNCAVVFYTSEDPEAADLAPEEEAA